MSDFPTYYYRLHISSVYLLIVVMASRKQHCFKPKQAQNLDENSDGDGEMKNLLETTDRCSCGLCQVLPTPKECIHCQKQADWKTRRRIQMLIWMIVGYNEWILLMECGVILLDLSVGNWTCKKLALTNYICIYLCVFCVYNFSLLGKMQGFHVS